MRSGAENNLKICIMKYWKNGFYDEPIDGSVEITEEYYQELLAGQSTGLIIAESKNRYPILVEYEYDIEDVIKNEQGCKILSNSEFAMILKQKPLDLPAICKIFDISEEESKYVIDSPAGQGIIVYGEDKVAFRNQIAKEFYIYQINQTSNMQISRS